MEDAEDVAAGAPGPSGRDQQQLFGGSGGGAAPLSGSGLPFDTQGDEEPLDAGCSDFELLKRVRVRQARGQPTHALRHARCGRAPATNRAPALARLPRSAC